MTVAVISNYLENKILDHSLRGTNYPTPGTSVYVALFTDATSQNDANGGTEVSTSGTAYVRQQVSAWAAPTSGSTSNSNTINFPTATGQWGNIRYVGIMDAATGGNLLFWGQLTADKDVGVGDTFSIAAGDLDLWLGGAISYALSGSIINHVLRNTAWTTPGTSVYVGLYSNNPNYNNSGTELSGNNYSRKQVTQWSTPVSGSTVNVAIEAFPAASAAWGTVTHIGILRASSGGDLMYFGPLNSSKTVGNGDTFRFSASTLSITLD